MPTLFPTIPEEITVHLGSPSANVQNVTVPFSEYIKNVASSEIYPTWEDSAIRANVLAQVSFALNRIYTEYYPSRGYNFDITSSTAIDQKFIYGRNTFENIDRIVDELFTTYIRRQGSTEPLAAKFCNGTTTTCDGLSQWGSQALAQEGYDSLAILRYYYGDNIELVSNAPIGEYPSAYPGSPLRLGDYGDAVFSLQVALNRISENYPAIPKIVLSGVFDQETENAVRKFQQIFDLTADGIAGQATFNRIISLYVGILGLAELESEGQTLFGLDLQFPGGIFQGDSGSKVLLVQYLLQLLHEYIPLIPSPELTGTLDEATADAIRAFQQYEGIPVTGNVDDQTYQLLFAEYAGIYTTSLISGEGDQAVTAMAVLPANQRERLNHLQTRMSNLSSAYPGLGQVRVTGISDQATVNAVRLLQKRSNLAVTGRMDSDSWRALQGAEDDVKYSKSTKLTQYPGYVVGETNTGVLV